MKQPKHKIKMPKSNPRIPTAAHTGSLEAYIREFDRLNQLKPVKYQGEKNAG